MKERSNREVTIHIHARITMLQATAEGDNTLTHNSTEPGPGFFHYQTVPVKTFCLSARS